jgi:hypothetical protein
MVNNKPTEKNKVKDFLLNSNFSSFRLQKKRQEDNDEEGFTSQTQRRSQVN